MSGSQGQVNQDAHVNVCLAYILSVTGQDLIKDLKSELSGNMEELILALFMPTTYYDAWSLRHAMKVQFLLKKCIC